MNTPLNPTLYRHLIDYVIVRRTDRQDVKVTKTMCGADCWTDHRLVVSKLNLRIQPARRPQGKKAPKRLDVSKLNKDSMRQDFLTDICNQLDAMNLSSEDPEENWTVFHKTVLSSAASTLGHPSRKHQDWFDENDDEIQRLLEEKHRLLKAHQDDTSSVSKKAAYSNICKTVHIHVMSLKEESGRFFFHFREIFEKCIEYNRKIPDSFQGDFKLFLKKWYILEEMLSILRLISWSLPDDEGGITCMSPDQA